ARIETDVRCHDAIASAQRADHADAVLNQRAQELDLAGVVERRRDPDGAELLRLPLDARVERLVGGVRELEPQRTDVALEPPRAPPRLAHRGLLGALPVRLHVFPR